MSSVTVLGLLSVVLVLAVAVAWRWRGARRAVVPLPVAEVVAIRGRGFNEDVLERAVGAAARDLDLDVVFDPTVPAWSTPAPTTVRVAGPVPGDRAVLVEVDADRAEDLLAEVLAVLLREGWTVAGGRGRRVVLRRHGLRASLVLAPA